jgi:hypothetical protein
MPSASDRRIHTSDVQRVNRGSPLAEPNAIDPNAPLRSEQKARLISTSAGGSPFFTWSIHGQLPDIIADSRAVAWSRFRAKINNDHGESRIIVS